MPSAGQFIDANGFLREADGRFAKHDGTAKPRRSSSGRRRYPSSGGRRSSGGGRKSTTEKIGLSAIDIGGSRLRESSNPYAQKAGVVLSGIGSLARNRSVRKAVRDAAKKRKSR